MPVIHGTPKTVAKKNNEIKDQTNPYGFIFLLEDFETNIQTCGKKPDRLLEN
jgi:hypothetical protein